MRVYIKREDHQFSYPDDMKKILDYLNAHGELKISDKTVEDFYRDFSDEYDASWLGATDEWIERFADWLADKEL